VSVPDPDAEAAVAGRFRYDPADPTPAVGGPRLVGQIAGRRDNTDLERRPDVLTFTSDRLAEPVEVTGPVTATVHLRSTRQYFDVFVRVCDVDPAGRSWNLCDGLTRVDPRRLAADPDGVLAVPVTLWPAAHRFQRGHRIRVQVSGGAHPRYARNPGTGAGLGEETELFAVEHEVLGGARYRSAVLLPVVH
jgi:putative CocE/NonD family hydrolase